MKRPYFANGEIYHIYNRGVEKRTVFIKSADYVRFLHDLFEFNDTHPASKYSEVQPPNISSGRELLVHIHTFCLMPNHYHLLVEQRVDNGVFKFMQKLGTGYTMYFNQRYERVGALFQGRFKAVHVADEMHFKYLPYYIHLNPISLTRNLEDYRWSSLRDYLGIKNFPSITKRDLLGKMLGNPTKQREELLNLSKNRQQFDNIDDVLLDHTP